MKKTLIRLLSGALCALTLAAPAAALTPGDPLGWVLHSDIVTYIDGHPIRSYNIGGYTYIVAEDLTQYGFHVEWNAASSRLIVHTDRTAAPDGYTADYVPEASRCPAGTPAMQYLHTDITAWIGETQVAGYNIGGYTCIGMDDLAAVFASDYVWDADARELRMTSNSADFAWVYQYTTPDYDANTVVNGVSAVWEFAKNEAGKFVLTHSEGDTNFTPSLRFGHDSLSYTIDTVSTKIGLAGSTYVYKAPHRLTAHTLASADVFTWHNGDWRQPNRCRLSDGRIVVPSDFASYVRSGDIAAVEHLIAQSQTLRDCLRVWYNDEPISLIGVGKSINTSVYTPTYRTYQLIYARSYAFDEVNRVRIAFCPPKEQAVPGASPLESAILNGQYMTIEQSKTLMDTIERDTTGTYVGLERKIRPLLNAYAIFNIRIDEESHPYLVSIETYGNPIVCETPLPLFGEHSWDCREEGDTLIFDHFADGVGWHCIVRKTGVDPNTKQWLAEQQVWTDQSPTTNLP